MGALLTYYGQLSGLPDPGAEARRALDRVQLPETWKVRAGTLSHGMTKRVAMAQALMGDPPVILLDEPTAGLDPKSAASVRGLIRELKRKHTVVVSSHNMQKFEELCDATAILDRGRLVSAAPLCSRRSRAANLLSTRVDEPQVTGSFWVQVRRGAAATHRPHGALGGSPRM